MTTAPRIVWTYACTELLDMQQLLLPLPCHRAPPLSHMFRRDICTVATLW